MEEFRGVAMSKFASSIYDLVKGIRAFKELANEFKEVYPEVSSIISSFSSKGSVSADDIRKAISFAVNKIMNDPYVVLGVRKDDPPELIEAVYKLKAKFYHPDNSKTGNKDKFIAIKEAYNKIKGGV